MSYLYALFVGVAMGFLIQRVGASSPGMILKNLRLENLAIIKFMATTIAIGMVVVYALSAAGVGMHFEIRPAYVIGVLVGGLVFGVGFAVGGFCPGTCIVGMGEGRRDALFALLGGVVGAFGYSLAYAALEPVLIQPANLGRITLADAVHLPSLVVAIALSALMLFIVWKLPTEVKQQS